MAATIHVTEYPYIRGGVGDMSALPLLDRTIKYSRLTLSGTAGSVTLLRGPHPVRIWATGEFTMEVGGEVADINSAAIPGNTLVDFWAPDDIELSFWAAA